MATLQEETSTAEPTAGVKFSLGKPDENGSAPPTEQLPEKPSDKERTLFCIKIDERCTEEILYELFLQVS